MTSIIKYIKWFVNDLFDYDISQTFEKEYYNNYLEMLKDFMRKREMSEKAIYKNIKNYK